ncbi:MAG TPA: ABC transporter permease, partial [Longimicrobiales bacterium]|nr:ABC transporter permease [Longimicrobiales bacterium]
MRAVLAAARRMVPRHHRDDWSREWSAELDTLWRPDPGRVPDGGGLALRRIRRTFLAVRDAVGIGAREVRLERALEEVRQAGRSVRRHPGASLGFAALLAAAVCATTLVAAVVHGVLRRPLPYPEPDRVVLVTPARPDGRGSGGHVSAAELLEVRRRARSLDVVGGVQHVSATLLDRGPPAEIPGARVSADALEALGVPAEHGRVFGPGEDGPGGPPVVLLSHGLWRGPFGGDPSIVGREVRLDGDGYTVLGVMPADFVLPTEVGASGSSAFFLPLAVDPADPGPVFVKELDGLVARLRPGVGLAAADADVGRVAGEIEAAHPENYRPGEWTLRARSPLARAVADARPVLAAVGLAVAFLLLALGANLVGLLASSGERRRGEMAVRRALGAGRLQLVRRLVTESLVLGVLAAPVGVGVAAACLPWIRSALADVLPRMGDVEVGPVAGWVLAATLAASVLLSLAPALRATTRVSAVSRAGRGGAGPPRAAARRWLMGGQLAVATVLLSGSVLFARSLANLLAVDPGFRASGVRLAELSLPSWRYQSAAEIEDFYRRLVEV